MPSESDRAAWLRQARHILAEDHGIRPGRVRVTVRDEDSGAESILRSPAPAGAGDGVLVALSPSERAIVQAVLDGGNRRMTAKKIAGKSGLRLDSTLYCLLSNLAQRDPPVLNSDRYGYVVVGPLARPASEGH